MQPQSARLPLHVPDVPFQGEDLGQIERDLLETRGPGGKG